MTTHQLNIYFEGWVAIVEGSGTKHIRSLIEESKAIEDYDACFSLIKVLNEYRYYKKTIIDLIGIV
tara:strand:+ start:602 stop:799 length:198 start_codon:yes stop_codon:yes gene_type:complete